MGATFTMTPVLPSATRSLRIRSGVYKVQGCINGYGERTGNADLCSVIPNITLKMGLEALPPGHVQRLTRVSHHVADVINLTLDPHLPFVGAAAFTHKAGLHTSALARRRDAYEHLPPEQVGNTARVVVSELAGRSTVLARAEAQDLGLTSEQAQDVVDRIKKLEHDGYTFEAADGSFELPPPPSPRLEAVVFPPRVLSRLRREEGWRSCGGSDGEGPYR